MTEALLVFVAQYLMVLLLGLQSLNVRDRHYVLAGITSFLLGVCGFYVTSVVGDAKGQFGTILWWSFVIAGPCGILTAMAIHPALVRAWERLR